MNNTINSLDKMYLNTDFDLIDEKEIYGYTFLRYGSLTTITETYKIARIVLFVLAMLFMVFSFLQFGNFVGISIVYFLLVLFVLRQTINNPRSG